MEVHLAVLSAVTFAVMVFWYWLYHIVIGTQMSGDKWYLSQFAYTGEPVTAPYCWRPLVPILARWFGFRLISYPAVAAIPIVVYFYVGGGWAGVACGLIVIGNPYLFAFNIKNPEYVEGVGQLLFIGSLWAMREEALILFPLLFLAALCRETIAAALGAIALFWCPLGLIPLVLGAVAAYGLRNECKENQHPLVEKTPYGTLVRWVREKGASALSWPHIIQPIRGLAFSVPFVWSGAGDFARLGLIGLVPIWLLALPASGQSRIVCYSIGLFLPFAAGLPAEWLWAFVILSWFWPVDYSAYKESGGLTFGYAR